MRKVETVKDFGKAIYKLGLSNRYVTVACGGFTGEGKSTFLIKLQKAYASISQTAWTFAHLTWSRAELMKWIDGDKNGKGQMPEYSAILVDELISLFFKRNWYENEQKAAIELLNKCRDRHLFIGGNIPNFWDLDSSFQSRMMFYVYIPRGRGIAWVFEQEDNPFSQDVWNCRENKKKFRKSGHPYNCPNFLCEIRFKDLTPEEKKAYLKIRNTKRRNTENQSKEEKRERYTHIKNQRDELIKLAFRMDPKITYKDIADLIGLSPKAVRYIRDGLR